MRTLILATAVVSVLAGTAAFAQQSQQPMMGHEMPGAMMGQGMMAHMMEHGMMPMMGMMDPSRHIEGRLAFLKTELEITEAQAPQWNAYADALRANAKLMGDLMKQMMPSGTMSQGMMTDQGNMIGNQGMMMAGQRGTMMSLPDRLKWAEQHITVHLEMLRALKGPTMQLYSVLSDEQKRTADELLGSMGMMGMM